MKKAVPPKNKKIKTLPLVGWREWVGLPDLGVREIKAKVDTGARTSALHISESELTRNGKKIKFQIHPKQRSNKPEILATANIEEYRHIKSSNGESSERPVIHTTLRLGKTEHTIELTLVNRDMMGFRLLLGREAIRNHYLVHPGKSFLTKKKPSIRKLTKASRKNKRSNK